MNVDLQGSAEAPPGRQIFCNRTLNLRAIRAVGYDMDYTLIHYHAHHWEARAFEYLRRKLLDRDWPVEGTTFDHQSVCRGLIIDQETGNIVKTNRFGYIKAACHGTRMLGFEEQRRLYARTIVDLTERRWVFLNTMFALSAGCMYRYLVDLLDSGSLPGQMNYTDLYRHMQKNLDAAHMEGQLKDEIINAPDRFVDLDAETPLALLDQKLSGKKLVLITNSGWTYTKAMMAYAFDPFLPDNMTWRELFDVAIVSARKPSFFAEPSLPVLEVVDEAQGLLKPHNGLLLSNRVYVGGDAGLVERTLGLSGRDILYVGDHVYGDVHASKSVRRWRTALIAREMEEEVEALRNAQDEQEQLTRLMDDKVKLERAISWARLRVLRCEHGVGELPSDCSEAGLKEDLSRLLSELTKLDNKIRPLAVSASRLGNPHWGLMMRTGNDKSHMARHVERHADVYTSRVSNFLYETPFSYIRSSRGNLPHDPTHPINPYPSDGD